MKRQGAILAFFLSALLVPAQEDPGSRALVDTPIDTPVPRGTLPLISRLDNRDLGFIQYQEDVERARRNLFGRGGGEGNAAETLTIYRYIPGPQEDLLFLAARCNIPYSSLATINRLSHPSLAAEMLLPSVPGIFIPLEPASDLERLLAAARSGQEGEVIRLGGAGGANGAGGEGPGRGFRFFPGDDFGPTERIFFLNRDFRFPLRNFTLTSAFGPRINPVTGHFRVHQGLDLAAPEGTDVFAAAEGEVAETGSDPVYGNYVIVRHRDDWVSLYGHLSFIGVVLRQELRSGSLIGRVGSTGQSTGPHLHFELRKNGKAQDPGKHLFR
ncbi:MAG: M23 family metallopeptidase [Spirochaetaceae bacterium]|nr:M23 family metallopeptidase [Spirochaetaceae bacterium]